MTTQASIDVRDPMSDWPDHPRASQARDRTRPAAALQGRFLLREHRKRGQLGEVGAIRIVSVWQAPMEAAPSATQLASTSRSAGEHSLSRRRARCRKRHLPPLAPVTRLAPAVHDGGDLDLRAGHDVDHDAGEAIEHEPALKPLLIEGLPTIDVLLDSIERLQHFIIELVAGA